MTKAWQKIVLWLTVSFLLCFLGIGYAQVSDFLNIQGVSNTTPPASVFITDAVPSGTGVTVNGYTGCILNSKADLSGASTVTVNVTVYNNSDVVYGYNVMKYVEGEGTYDNPDILVSTTMQKKHKDWKIEPSGYLTFPVTFSFKNGSASNKLLNSVIEFEFLPFDEIPVEDDETTVSNAMDRFEEILNTPAEHEQLNNYMDNVPNNDRNSSYISNVPGANATDISSIESLFAGNLHININGQQTNVKIMIKEENITNSYSGNEMVIYMTTDPLDTRWSTAIVYRCVFVNDNGVWKRMNDIAQGTANVCDYSSGMRWGTGSFNTDSWKAS